MSALFPYCSFSLLPVFHYRITSFTIKTSPDVDVNNLEYCVFSQHSIEVIYTRLLIHQKSNVKDI